MTTTPLHLFLRKNAAIGRTTVDAVLFDLDGVLFDTERVYLDASKAALREIGGRSNDFDWLLDLTGLSGADCASLVSQRLGPRTAQVFDSLYRMRREELLANGPPLCHGAIPAITALSAAGLALGVVTNASRMTTLRYLKSAGISGCFSCITAREDASRPKPSGDIYDAAARALGRDPAACVALEDSQAGVFSAVAAGMSVIAVPNLVDLRPQVMALCLGVVPDLEAATEFVLGLR